MNTPKADVVGKTIVFRLIYISKPEGWYNGIVRLWDLPKELTYIDFKPSFKKRFLSLIKGQFTWRHVSEQSGISYKKLEHFREGHRISLDVLQRLLRFGKQHNVEIIIDTIEANISRIGSCRSEIINPKLPFNFCSEDGAKIISAALCDGGIKSKSLIFFYTNTQSKKRDEIAKSVENVFGNMNDINTMSYIVEFPNITGMALTYGIGLVAGQKVINNPRIPEFLFRLVNDAIISYLRQAFDDEGYVCCGKNKKFVGITSNTASEGDPPMSNLLCDTKQLLNIVGINSGKIHKSKHMPKRYRGKMFISQEWKLLIMGIYSLEKFRNIVNFGLDYKKENLDKIIKNLRESSKSLQKPKGLAEKEAHTVIVDALVKLDYIDNRFLASKMGISVSWAKDLLKKLETKGLIQPVMRGKSYSPTKFTLKDSVASLPVPKVCSRLGQTQQNF